MGYAEMPSKEEYWRNPEKHRADARQYAIDHPDWHRESNKQWARKKRAADPEPSREATRKWLRKLSPEQREERNAKTREWFANNPGYSNEWQKKNRGRDPLRHTLSQAKIRARRKGIPFELTRQDVTLPEICPVLGTPIDYKALGSFNPNSASLDRLIPALGYVPGNVRIISNRANILKRDATIEELEAVVAYMRRELSG